MKEYNRVYAKIDLDAAAYNMEQMKNRIGGGARLIAVVKTDAYGHGAVPLAEVFEKLDYVWGYAVATLDEGIVLRKHGIKKPILVLGCVFPDQYDDMVRNEIRAAVYMEEMAGKIAEAAERAGKKAYIHIKVDTGMGRIGFPVTEESADIIERISRMENIEVEGMFTHFAKADERDKTYTYEQHRKFMWMKVQMEKRNVVIPYYDCDNSAGIIDFPDMKHDLARAGISTYGMYPSEEVNRDAVDLKPVLSLVSHVIFCQDGRAGDIHQLWRNLCRSKTDESSYDPCWIRRRISTFLVQ